MRISRSTARKLPHCVAGCDGDGPGAEPPARRPLRAALKLFVA